MSPVESDDSTIPAEYRHVADDAEDGGGELLEFCKAVIDVWKCNSRIWSLPRNHQPSQRFTCIAT